MTDYSKETQQWFEEIREGLRDWIETFESLSGEEEKDYPTVRDWLVWSAEKQEKWGQVGPIESDIDDIWDEINELNSAQNWANTGSQIESEEINVELRRLYDLFNEIQNSGSAQERTRTDSSFYLHTNTNIAY